MFLYYIVQSQVEILTTSPWAKAKVQPKFLLKLHNTVLASYWVPRLNLQSIMSGAVKRWNSTIITFLARVLKGICSFVNTMNAFNLQVLSLLLKALFQTASR